MRNMLLYLGGEAQFMDPIARYPCWHSDSSPLFLVRNKSHAGEASKLLHQFRELTHTSMSEDDLLLVLERV